MEKRRLDQMTKMSKKELEFEKWLSKNGACNFDFRLENIKFYNGGLFQDMNEDYAELWAGDLNETIRYLKRLKSFLNKQGIDTGRDYSDFVIKKIIAKRKRTKNGKTNKGRRN